MSSICDEASLLLAALTIFVKAFHHRRLAGALEFVSVFQILSSKGISQFKR